MVKGRNYTFAIYNKENNLLTHPIQDLLSRVASNQPPLTDIYVISHGWDYTITEAIGRYQLYMSLMDEFVKGRTNANPDFQPYFIFVSWVSVARPTTELVRAILPFGIDKGLTAATKVLDNVVFYLPTAWNQSLNAAINASGKTFMNYYANESYDEQPYAVGSFDETKIGRDVPMSGVLYKILELNKKSELGSGKPVKIHSIGHSFGAKLIGMATLDALARIDRNLTLPIGNHIESLVMINPAASPGELFPLKQPNSRPFIE